MGAAAPRKRALLVEDDAAIRELVRFHLDLSGYDVDEASDGRQALAQARAGTFDLILLDVMLPGLDGITVCRAIRREGPNQQTPILMVTARDGESDTVVGLESGADDYLAKPFGVRELMAPCDGDHASAPVARRSRCSPPKPSWSSQW
jgi:DNA-binding response OmpR family regulator